MTPDRPTSPAHKFNLLEVIAKSQIFKMSKFDKGILNQYNSTHLQQKEFVICK